ncbi:Plasma kallikrein [Smittium culicis]|uniref:Plasma kallikrein n=1 Tax=Smittium culicis TaxID=133412 RepID=A0A1R1XF52_9FUNG|nr:Plasma kallikrein [Smittium culicis]
MSKFLQLLCTLLSLTALNAKADESISQPPVSENKNSTRPDFRIINGAEASLSQFPFTVFIYFDLNDSAAVCGGTLIAPNVVITAAHCLYDGVLPISKYNIYVSAGSVYNIVTNDNMYSVSRSIPHPSYSARTAANDIGILILSKSTTVSPSDFAKIYDLPISNDFTTAAAGWGKTSNIKNDTVSDVLMTVPLVLSSSSNCKKFNPRYTNNDGMVICTENKNSQDTCYGDSGGPFVYTGVSPYPLLGVTSFGNSPAAAAAIASDPNSDAKPSCADNDGYGYYTHVYYYIDWIVSSTSLDKNSITYSKKDFASDPSKATPPSISQTSRSPSDVFSTLTSSQKGISAGISLKTQSGIISLAVVSHILLTLFSLF